VTATSHRSQFVDPTSAIADRATRRMPLNGLVGWMLAPPRPVFAET
jgi:hypothetical protein